MKQLVLADKTKKFALSFARSLPHATLLTGIQGVGLNALAEQLAQTNGTILARINPIAKTAKSQPIISVEQVRGIYSDVKANFQSPHFVIIDTADTMNTAAQNALLKVLEEPNSSIHFILTSHRSDLLLPTIRSRVRAFHVPQIDVISSRRLLKSFGIAEEAKINQVLYVSSGRPALMYSLAHDQTAFETLTSNIQLAKQFINGSKYQKLVIANSFKEDRARAIAFIEVLLDISKIVSNKQASRPTLLRIERLIEVLEAIKANGNVRLQIAAAVV